MVSVLFCDVRGFSQKVEESSGDLHALLARVRPGRPDHPRGAVQLRELDRGLADHTSGAQHHHGLARPQLTAPGQGHVCRDRGEPNPQRHHR